MKNSKAKITDQKADGRYYTPDYLVKNILDLTGYTSSNILKKHIIDNSCGDGAFLTEVVNRYCCAFLDAGGSKKELKEDLSHYIHGIEIEESEWKKTIDRLNEAVNKFSINNIQWDIIHTDTLECDRFNEQMDFVVGNPPYVRVHNLNERFRRIKQFRFAQSGMTDLFIVFYEIGLKMLKSGGRLAYITPSSLFNSLASKTARREFIASKCLDTIVNLKHTQPFDVTTYTTIVILQDGKTDSTVHYYEYDDLNKVPVFIDDFDFDTIFIDGIFYFGSRSSLSELHKILTEPVYDFVEVKNGFATLADSFFIGNFDFKEFVIPVIKASTGQWHQSIFPYQNGKLVSWNQIGQFDHLAKYYEQNRSLLEKRSIDASGTWYGFGRSQGVNDVYRKKWAVNALIKTPETIKLVKSDPGTGVYSGLYILPQNIPQREITDHDLRQILFSEDFLNYIALLGKYKSGGYYTFSSKDLKQFLNFKLEERYHLNI